MLLFSLWSFIYLGIMCIIASRNTYFILNATIQFNLIRMTLLILRVVCVDLFVVVVFCGGFSWRSLFQVYCLGYCCFGQQSVVSFKLKTAVWSNFMCGFKDTASARGATRGSVGFYMQRWIFHWHSWRISWGNLRSPTLRQKLQTKLAISTSHSIAYWLWTKLEIALTP